MKLSATIPAAIALFAVAGCGRNPDSNTASPSAAPMRVQVAVAKAETLPALTEITGTVRPVQRAELAAKVMGAIDELPVALGQTVHRGDLLAKISAGDISARVAQAQSQVNQVNRELARERELLSKGASTRDTVSNLEDRDTAAHAMLTEAEAMLGYATIRAPFDGVIAGKHANAGDLASPGMPLVEIEGLGSFEVETGIPDSLAGALSPGASFSVSIPAASLSFKGRLSEMSSASDPNSHTVSARISVPGDVKVRSGQFARIQVPGAPVRALFVPSASVSTAGQMERVFVVGDGNRAVLRLVRTGATRGDRTEILSGLDDGERVIVAPPAGLSEGRQLDAQP